MEYSVGSLADLISGTKTLNKPKVVKKEFKPILSEDDNTEISKPKAKKTIDKTEEPDSPKPKTNLKRKLETGNSQKGAKKGKLTRNEKNAAKRVLNKERELQKQNPEDNERTIYIGNVPLGTTIEKTKKAIKQHFRKYGEVESLRVRGIPVDNPKTSKKVAAIKNKFNAKRSDVFCYLKYKVKEDAEKALAENGQVFNEHHLKVELVSEEKKIDESKSIFIGNIPFDAKEDDLWKLFESCGQINNVRLVRDKLTGMGKGFGYVNFETFDGVQLALEMEDVKLGNRELRIKLCNSHLAKKDKKTTKVRKFREHKGTQEGAKHSEGAKKEKKYQGSKFNVKNKKKVNKGLLQKKKLVKKIAPKPK